MISPTFLARSVAQVKKLRGKNLLLAHFADLWEYGSQKVATFLAPHIQSVPFCVLTYILIYIYFQISIFLKVGVYQYMCLLMWQIMLKRRDYLYSNIVDYQWQFSSVWSLWGSVTLRVSSWIDQTHHSWWIECSIFLSKKGINFTQFLIKNCFSLLKFSWIFVFLITFQEELSIDDDLIPVINPGKRNNF